MTYVVLNGHMKKTRDIIARERMSKSRLKNKSAGNADQKKIALVIKLTHREIKELEGQLSEKENCKTNQRARRKIELEGKLKEKSKSQKEN